MRFKIFKLILWILIVFVSFKIKAQKKPNIILIVADDLGWSDLSCYGNPIIETPNIDKLARGGMRFTNAYSDAVCTPTRAALQTGKYSAKIQMTDVANGHRRPWAKLNPPEVYWQLKPELFTISEEIQSAGYVSGIFGKWHLGIDDNHQPKDFGYSKPQNYPIKGEYAEKVNSWIIGNPYKNFGNQIKESIQFIEQNKDAPFFCIVSYFAVHTPPNARKELIEKYKRKVTRIRTIIDPIYAAMCETMDESVGLLLEVIASLGIQNNTLIFFYSDNGGVIEERGFLFNGYSNLVTHNWPLRGEKGSLYEGGIRVPLIAYWPGNIENECINESPVHAIDFFPTIVDLSGAEKTVDNNFDGISIVPFLKDKNHKIQRELFWHYPHYHHSTPASAILSGEFKLIYFYETKESELYHLPFDISEQYNLCDSLPFVKNDLQIKLSNWLNEINAGIPEDNPFYDPNRQLIWGERIRNVELKDIKTLGLQ